VSVAVLPRGSNILTEENHIVKKNSSDGQKTKELRLGRETIKRLTIKIRSGIRAASNDAGQCTGGNKIK
jgi:hypothetical protein